MTNTPDEQLQRRVLAWWSVAHKIGSGLLGFTVIILDAVIFPPANTTTSSVGLLLLGYPLVAAAQSFFAGASRGSEP